MVKYPTWYEWQAKNFPNRSQVFAICDFDNTKKSDCSRSSCRECINSPIPYDIAEKLGIKPKES